MPIDLPLDADGFLRRECPTCERQFKWWPTPPPEEFSEETQEAPEAYYCPYCHEPADPKTWWTKEQLEYVQKLAVAEVLEPEMRRFKNDMERINPRSRGQIRFDVSSPPLSRPKSLTEPDDMVRVDVPCHPEEPTKVLLRTSSCWTVVCATPASSPSCLWVRPRRRRSAARAGSGVLLDLSIILTLLVVGSSFTNEVPKRAEEVYPQSTGR